MQKMRVQIMMSPKLVEKIDQFAEELGYSRSGTINWIMASYFANKDKLMEKLANPDSEIYQVIKQTLETMAK